MKIKINSDLGKYKKGTVIKIAVDSNNIPIDKYWRARLKDSIRDNCIEIVKKEKSQEVKIKSNKKRVD